MPATKRHLSGAFHASGSPMRSRRAAKPVLGEPILTSSTVSARGLVSQGRTQPKGNCKDGRADGHAWVFHHCAPRAPRLSQPHSSETRSALVSAGAPRRLGGRAHRFPTNCHANVTFRRRAVTMRSRAAPILASVGGGAGRL